MRLTPIEGNRQRLDGGAMYGNAPKSLWQTWSPPDENNRIELACRSLLVETSDRRILCEAGIGTFFSPELRARFGVSGDRHVLVDSLAKVGLSDSDIDVVLLSHLHFDHAGGLLSSFEEGAKLLFPKAQFVVGRTAWERALHPHARDRASFVATLNAQLESSGRLHLVDGAESDILGKHFRLHYSDGHTPGLTLAEVASDTGPVLFASDLVPGVPWVHVPITMGYDRYPERLIDEKVRLLADLYARGGSLCLTHDPAVAIGTLTRDAKGRFGVQAQPA